MFFEFPGRRRFTGGVQVIGRRTQDAPRRHDLLGDQARRVRGFGDSYRDIEALLDRVDKTVVEQEFDMHVRVRGHEVGNHDAQVLRTERHRCVDP